MVGRVVLVEGGLWRPRIPSEFRISGEGRYQRDGTQRKESNINPIHTNKNNPDLYNYGTFP